MPRWFPIGGRVLPAPPILRSAAASANHYGCPATINSKTSALSSRRLTLQRSGPSVVTWAVVPLHPFIVQMMRNDPSTQSMEVRAEKDLFMAGGLPRQEPKWRLSEGNLASATLFVEARKTPPRRHTLPKFKSGHARNALLIPADKTRHFRT